MFWFLNILNISKALGAPVEGQLLFQTPASPYMEGIVDLHHYVMFFLVFISVFVLWLLVVIVFSFNTPDLLIRSEKLICNNFINVFTSFNKWWYFHNIKPLNLFDFFKGFKFIRNIFWFLDFNSSLYNLFRYNTLSTYIRYKHGTVIEFVWTVFPCFILLLIAIPSYRLLFSAEDVVSMHHVIKVIGHQWYWTYEYTYVVDQLISGNDDWLSLLNSSIIKDFVFDVTFLDYNNENLNLFGKFRDLLNIKSISLNDIINFKEIDFFQSRYNNNLIGFFDNTFQIFNIQSNYLIKSMFITSYMLPESDLPFGGLRLLEVDNVLRVPAYTHLHFIITSSDVIHSWAIPSLGIKIDAVPGRLNENVAYIARPGVFYGQCSEICGVNHAFMPICIVAFDK